MTLKLGNARLEIIETCIAITSVFIVNTLAIIFNIYEIFPPIDIPLHIGGGIAVGYMFFVLVKLFDIAPSKIILLAFSWIILVTISWEAFELIVDRLTGSNVYGDILDTIGDIINGIIGCIIVVIIKKRTSKS